MPRFQNFQRDYKHLVLPARKSIAFFPWFPQYGGGWKQLREVPLKDRIPHWNIVPGDRVRVVRGPPGMQFCDGRVKRVLRRFNVVFLAGRPFQKKTVHKFRSADLAHHFKRPPISYDDIPIHYSTVRLIKEGSDGKVKVASRVKRGPVSRHPNGMLFWKRWGLFNGVWEEIPVQTAPVKVKVKQEAPDGLAFSLTDWEEASKVTYQPTLTPKAEILLGGLQAAKRKNNDLPSEMILNTLELRRNLRRNKSDFGKPRPSSSSILSGSARQGQKRMLSNTAHARVHPNAQDPHSPLLPQNGIKWDAPALDSRLDVSSMPSIGEGFDELDFPNDSTTKSTPSPLLPSDVKDESPLSVMNQLWEPPLPPAQRDEHNKAMQSILLGLRQRQPNRLLLDGWKVLDRLGTTERIKRDEDVVQMVHIITSEKLDFLYGNWDLAKRFLLWALERCGVRVIEIACWQLLRQLETKRCIEIWETASPHLSSVEINNKSSLSIGNSFLASVLAHALAKDRKSFKETLPRLVQSWPELPYLHIRSLPRQKVDSFFRDVPEIKDDADRCLQWAKQAIFVIKLKNAEDPDEYVRSSADSWTKRNVPRDLEDLWEDYRAALNEGETQWIESFKAVDDSEAVDDFARQLWGSSSRPVEGNRQLIPNATINPAVLQAFLMCFTQHKLDTHAAEVWSLIKSFGFHRFRSSWYSVLWINMKTRNLRNLKIAMVDMNQLGLKPDAFCYALLTKCLMQEARGSHELDSDSRRQIELQAQKYMDGIFQSSKMRELERDNRFHPIVFTTLLEGFLPMRREQDVENLFTLAKELCRGSPVELYNTLLEFHGRNKNPAIAMQTMSMTLKRMVAANVEPNGGTFAILMKYGPRHAIPSIIENMRNMGLHVSIGTVIQKYIASLTLTGKLADLETAVYVISQVESRFSDRDGSIIYTTLMDGFLNALKFAAESEYHHKCLNSALQCLEHMIHKKYPVTTTTYNILLSELLQVGTEETVTRAMEVYEALRKRLQGSARSPKLERSYYFLLRTLWRMGKTDELLKVLSDMRADGILPTTERFKRLLERIYGDSSPFNF